MTDTPSDVSERYTRELLRLRPELRLAMACSMFSSARSLSLAGIRRRNGTSSGDERALLFLRMYGQEFAPAEQKSIAESLRAA